jgi:hypothetical protein
VRQTPLLLTDASHETKLPKRQSAGLVFVTVHGNTHVNHAGTVILMSGKTTKQGEGIVRTKNSDGQK